MDAAAQRIPGDDRAFLYGDALFETVLCIHRQPLWLPLHLDRLMEGASRLHIPVARVALQERVESALKHVPTDGAAVLRLTLSRGSAARGYRPPESPQPRLLVTSAPLSGDAFAPPPPLRIGTAVVQLAEQPALAGIKHGNRLEQVLGAREASERGLDDVLMCSTAGFAQCSSNANLFAVQGGVLVTPPCDRCGVAGTRRRLVLETLLPRLGLRGEVRTLELRELYDSDAMMLCNSVRGLQPVRQLDDRRYEPSEILQRLHRVYVEAGRQWLSR